jgi:alpha-tubulin suppressor-like RCC1 family protein
MQTAAASGTKSVKSKKEKEVNWNYIKYFKRPEHVDTVPEMKQISKVFAGSNYCYGLNETTNELWSWGFGYNYVLGTKEEDNCWIPTLVHPKMMYE